MSGDDWKDYTRPGQLILGSIVVACVCGAVLCVVGVIKAIGALL